MSILVDCHTFLNHKYNKTYTFHLSPDKKLSYLSILLFWRLRNTIHFDSYTEIKFYINKQYIQPDNLNKPLSSVAKINSNQICIDCHINSKSTSFFDYFFCFGR
jgi:hypothetical protein